MEDQGLEHQGLDPQDLDQAQYADHPGHHMLDPQTQHILDASLGHAGHPGLSGVHHLDPHGSMDQQVLDGHALGHHPGALPIGVRGHNLNCGGAGICLRVLIKLAIATWIA